MIVITLNSLFKERSSKLSYISNLLLLQPYMEADELK